MRFPQNDFLKTITKREMLQMISNFETIFNNLKKIIDIIAAK